MSKPTALIEITSCQMCPHLDMDAIASDVGFDRGINWYCERMDNK